MVKLSKVNLFLHQFPSPAIHIYDTLSNDARWSEKADLILANPPFMTPKGGVTPHPKFRIPAKKAEVLFTDYIAEHFTPDGRAGIVATSQNADVKLRRFLVEDSLVAVVSLPAGVFKPYSGVKTSILLLDKKFARHTDKIRFLKITADGFDLGYQRREILANDLPEAARVMKAWLRSERLSVQGQRPETYQHGATPHETNPPTTRGLKARPISAPNKSGLQPSAQSSNHEPGALPQADMASAVGADVAWKLVEKRELLGNQDATLNAERYTNGAIAEHDHEIVTIGEICLDVQSGYSCSPNKQTATGVPHLRSQNITDQGQLVWERAKFVPLEIAQKTRVTRYAEATSASTTPTASNS